MPQFSDETLAHVRERLASRVAFEIDAPEYRRACVLIPLIHDRGEWSLVFSRRSPNLAAHSGQIAFPGGAAEPGESLEDAAIREAEEEVGIQRDAVELIGRLDDLITNSGYLVAPFVGIIRGRIDYVLQESEVDEVFEVPVDALLDPSQPEVRYVAFRGKEYPAYFYRYEQYEIWGLTGRMVKGFLDLVWASL